MDMSIQKKFPIAGEQIKNRRRLFFAHNYDDGYLYEVRGRLNSVSSGDLELPQDSFVVEKGTIEDSTGGKNNKGFCAGRNCRAEASAGRFGHDGSETAALPTPLIHSHI